MECTEIEFPHEPYFLASLSTFHSPYISSDFLIQYLSMYLSVLADIGKEVVVQSERQYIAVPSTRSTFSSAATRGLFLEHTGFEELLSDSFSSMLFSCSKGQERTLCCLRNTSTSNHIDFLTPLICSSLYFWSWSSWSIIKS